MNLNFTVPPSFDEGRIEAALQSTSCLRARDLKVAVERGLPVEETLTAQLDAVGAKYCAREWGSPAVLIDETDFCLLDAVGAKRAWATLPMLEGSVERLHSVFMTGVTLLYRSLFSIAALAARG